MRIRALRLVVALLWLSMASLAVARSAANATSSSRTFSVPHGFTDTVVTTGVAEPTALAATPDGRILVTDQVGLIRVIADDVLVPAPALDLSRRVCSTTNERGLLGIAVDPHFRTNGYVYVYYTFKKYPGCKTVAVKVPVNRVSRFTMVGNVIKSSSEKVLVDDMVSYHGNHNAGDVGFGNDGLLYASVGDGGCDYTLGTQACEGSNTISQRRNTLQGKVLRIKPDGGIPADNPFTGTDTARCNHGAITAGSTCQEIYMLGLRNPFRFAFDPNSAKTRLFVNDVGATTWEEIDRAAKGANYGWNTREGSCATGSTTDCGPPPPGFTNPIFSYAHSAGPCQAITGGAFVPSHLWGTAYNHGYLYSDYTCGTIFLLKPDGARGWISSEFATGIGAGGPVAMLFAPHRATTSLYYTTYSHAGQVRVIDRNP